MEIKDDDIKLETRTRVMRYALYTENGINDLLLKNLVIFDKTKTKNFGNKAGISFQSKIDLLLDINILTKEEHLDLELLMNFRNKFLHLIDCNTFVDVIKYLDNSIVNRFRKHIDKSFKIENEEAYENGCLNLHIRNAKTISDKHNERNKTLNERAKFLIDFARAYTDMQSLSFSFVLKIMDISKSLDLANAQDEKIYNLLLQECTRFSEDLKNSDNRKFIDSLDFLPENLFLGLIK